MEARASAALRCGKRPKRSTISRWRAAKRTNPWKSGRWAGGTSAASAAKSATQRRWCSSRSLCSSGRYRNTRSIGRSARSARCASARRHQPSASGSVANACAVSRNALRGSWSSSTISASSPRGSADQPSSSPREAAAIDGPKRSAISRSTAASLPHQSASRVAARAPSSGSSPNQNARTSPGFMPRGDAARRAARRRPPAAARRPTGARARPRGRTSRRASRRRAARSRGS